ncbi:MAG: acylneuraminate cytidylyltransferase [Anaerolineae bacterium]|nr:MAG: acylneuraminate cytidylyltransferase [Anaerolineae bacterium]
MVIIAIIQARMTSSRLPGKVLRDIAARPMLGWVVERARRASTVSQVIVATTTDPSDDPVAAYCGERGYDCIRGSLNDVLDRYYQAALQAQAEVVVRITADCPFIDPALIDDAIGVLLEGGFDFVANRLPRPWGRTYPIGLDVEVFTFAALETAWQQATEKHQREHVTPYFYEDTPANALRLNAARRAEFVTPRGFRIALLHAPADYGHLRWTVDTAADLELARRIAAYFPDDTFSWTDILRLVEGHPELTQINAAVPHKTHLDVDDRL